MLAQRVGAGRARHAEAEDARGAPVAPHAQGLQLALVGGLGQGHQVGADGVAQGFGEGGEEGLAGLGGHALGHVEQQGLAAFFFADVEAGGQDAGLAVDVDDLGPDA